MKYLIVFSLLGACGTQTTIKPSKYRVGDEFVCGRYTVIVKNRWYANYLVDWRDDYTAKIVRTDLTNEKYLVKLDNYEVPCKN